MNKEMNEQPKMSDIDSSDAVGNPTLSEEEIAYIRKRIYVEVRDEVTEYYAKWFKRIALALGLLLPIVGNYLVFSFIDRAVSEKIAKEVSSLENQVTGQIRASRDELAQALVAAGKSQAKLDVLTERAEQSQEELQALTEEAKSQAQRIDEIVEQFKTRIQEMQ